MAEVMTSKGLMVGLCAVKDEEKPETKETEKPATKRTRASKKEEA